MPPLRLGSLEGRRLREGFEPQPRSAQLAQARARHTGRRPRMGRSRPAPSDGRIRPHHLGSPPPHATRPATPPHPVCLSRPVRPIRPRHPTPRPSRRTSRHRLPWHGVPSAHRVAHARDHGRIHPRRHPAPSRSLPCHGHPTPFPARRACDEPQGGIHSVGFVPHHEDSSFPCARLVGGALRHRPVGDGPHRLYRTQLRLVHRAQRRVPLHHQPSRHRQLWLDRCRRRVARRQPQGPRLPVHAHGRRVGLPDGPCQPKGHRDLHRRAPAWRLRVCRPRRDRAVPAHANHAGFQRRP